MTFALRQAHLLPLLLLLPSGTFARETAPIAAQAHHREVMAAVVGILQSSHYAARPLQGKDTLVWFDAYLDRLDPGRAFLTAADVAQFRPRTTEMAALTAEGQPDLSLAIAVHERLTERARRAFKVASEELDKPLSFDDPAVAIPGRGEEPERFATVADMEAFWRQRARAEVLNGVLAGESVERATEIVKGRFVRRDREVTQRAMADVLEHYLSALGSVFDPHSAYFKPDTSDDFDIRMRDALEGIGAELRMDEAYTTITRLIPGGPAEASGQLRRGDRIVAVGQGSDKPVDVVDMRLDQVVRLIRGPKGTEVRLTIRPAGASDPSETRVVTIIRDRVKLENASAKGTMHEVPGPDGRSVKVGVVEIPTFYFDTWAGDSGDAEPRSTTADTRREVLQLKEAGAEVVVVDLRGNGGGPLTEAIGLTGLFIDRGPVVQVSYSYRRPEVKHDPIPGVVWAGPLVVLTDELSASASEIFAGALQDYRRAVVVGARQTHGKGTVQTVLDLGSTVRQPTSREFVEQAGALKFTIQMFYRVTGSSTQNRGVVPDIVLPSPWEGLDVLESDLDRPLPYAEIKPATYTPLPMTIDLEPIRARSESRVASEPVFGWFAEDRAELERQRQGAPLSLHLPTREAERERNRARIDARRAHLGLPPLDPTADPDDEDDGEVDGNGDGPATLSEAIDRVILTEAMSVAADVARAWTPIPELLMADSDTDLPRNRNKYDRKRK